MNPEYWYTPRYTALSTIYHSSCSRLDQSRSAENHRLSHRRDPGIPEHFSGCRLRFTDEQRRRLGVKADEGGELTLFYLTSTNCQLLDFFRSEIIDVVLNEGEAYDIICRHGSGNI